MPRTIDQIKLCLSFSESFQAYLPIIIVFSALTLHVWQQKEIQLYPEGLQIVFFPEEATLSEEAGFNIWAPLT